MSRALRLVLFGDGESPHLLKWARALAPRTDLYVASSRGFAPALAAIVPASHRFALDASVRFSGGNVGLLRGVPRLARWLRTVKPDWINAHYLTSHGTMAWLATRFFRVRARLAGSAWGSDILVAPTQGALLRRVTSLVLRACEVTTSDSAHMADRMRALGAREVMTFPFGLEAMPRAPLAGERDDALFFANRGLEPIYAPQRVLDVFASIAASWPEARLVVANTGSLSDALKAQAARLGLGARVSFVGRMDAETQSRWYAKARWYLSLPRSDSVSVSVIEAMAHGCIPILSDLPANEELVRHGVNGVIVEDGAVLSAMALAPLRARADAVATANRDWVAANALFGPSVERFVARLKQARSE
jgi:glycosyltransferase involved in cell wall biosynthesis